jgi:L-2-hydroxyglutarate oxidase LhgO
MTADYKIVIIGAGVVGLAIARALAKKGESSVLILEKEDSFGHGASSRNSEVIHSGLYYPDGSLKASYCVRANKQLYQFCDEESIWYNKCGKLVISQKGQNAELKKLFEQGRRNGVDGMRMIGKQEIVSLEPNIDAESAIFIESTGIISAHELMSAFKRISTNANHDLLYMSTVNKVIHNDKIFSITVGQNGSTEDLVTANWVINAAGLYSAEISKMVMDANTPKLQYSKGEYFKLSSKWRSAFSHLVYPLPDKEHDSLGIHLSFDKSGMAKLGPSATWLSDFAEEYEVDSNLKKMFFNEANKYIPDLKIDQISPDFSGIRPKYFHPNQAHAEFYIRHEYEAGLEGWINLIGIDSPGLTSAISIGEDVAGWVIN